MLALDARTGAKRWETRFADTKKGYSAATGPIVIKGKLLQGLNGCDRFKEDGCFITAIDAATGNIAWRFNTVARPEEPGGDTWGKQPMMFRGGGETWITGSYDPDLNLTYWGTAQAKPWVPASRGMTALDKALYTSSTVALNPDTGKLVWYFQHAPGEALDLDEVFERVLVDDNGRKLSFSTGKPGILWKLDRQTGQYIGHKETVFQNIFESIDPKTGTPTYRGDIIEAKVGQWISACPSTQGGKNWHSSTYHPGSNLIIIPLNQTLPGDLRPPGGVQGRLRRDAGRSPVVRDAGHRRQDGQVRGLRRADDARGVGSRAARVVDLGGALHRRRPRVHGRPRSLLPRPRRENGTRPLADAPRHVGAGVPDLVRAPTASSTSPSRPASAAAARATCRGCCHRRSGIRRPAMRCTCSSCRSSHEPQRHRINQHRRTWRSSGFPPQPGFGGRAEALARRRAAGRQWTRLV